MAVMPKIGNDPFQVADQYNQQMTQLGAQGEANAQNALMRMFATEAARQAPWADLPVDLAKQNNQSANMLKLYGGKEQIKQASGNFKVPADAAAFGSKVINDLTGDLGISAGAASGLVGNLASETGNFRHLQELDPVVPGSRGGAGWAMWTGPRRKDFEAYTGGNTTSPEANYAYLVHDLQENYPQVLEKLRQTDNPLVAAQIIHNEYLKPGIPHLRKSAVTAQKYYENFNVSQNKRVAGDAEYDRRQARKAEQSGSKKGTFVYGGKEFTLGDDDAS